MESDSRPLVSLCITCYNQAKYIREAVQSAFDQTYSSLEIVISDDCSTDGTDKIVEDMVKEYSGPHRIIFNRNKVNLFVARNYEKAFRLAHGELLITGAGDDVSMPNRASRIVEEWLLSGKKATFLLHYATEIDAEGRTVRCTHDDRIDIFRGAYATYCSGVVKKFLPLSAGKNVYEDHVFSTRAFLLGEVRIIREPLVAYRLVGLTSSGGRDARIRSSGAALPLREVQLSDIRYSKSFTDDATRARVRGIVELRYRHYLAEYRLNAGRYFWTRLYGLLQMTRRNGWFFSPKGYFLLAFKVLPYRMGDRIAPVLVWGARNLKRVLRCSAPEDVGK